jgi:hypothetical protein
MDNTGIPYPISPPTISEKTSRHFDKLPHFVSDMNTVLILTILTVFVIVAIIAISNEPTP